MHTTADRNLALAFNELARVKDKLGLPDAIIEKTVYIYRKVTRETPYKGKIDIGHSRCSNIHRM